MNASSSIIVWEWEAQTHVWVPHSPKLCQHIENEYRRCMGTGSVDLGGQDEIAFTGFQLDFGRMKEVNTNTNEFMRVRRQPYSADCPFAQGISWKWSAYFNQMQFYDVATSNYIEEAFQQKSRRVDLRRSPLRIPNVIHFSTMEQVNRKTKYSRKVQREETKEKYPLTNHETTNMSGQHGSMVQNPMLPSLSGSVITHSSHLAAVPSSTQIHYPIMTSGSKSMTHAQSNLGNPSCRFSRPRSGLSTSTVTANSNTGIQLTWNPAFQNMSTVGTSTMTNINTSSLSMPKRSPLYHQPPSYLPYSPSYAPSNYGASGTSGMSQASSSVSVASTTRKSRKQASRATPTQRQTRTISGPLGNFARSVQVGAQSDDECAICLESLTTPSDYDKNPKADVQCLSADVLELLQCKHMFHRMCLQRLYESGATQNGCLRCPTCKTIHGVMKGNQPGGGTMRATTNSNDIPGYPGCGSIVIVYSFSSGTQGPNHPNPGQPYHASAFPRTCYLPNNNKGKKVLDLLKIAFDRQLVFTVGRSVTTGQDNCVVWNDIHHKTEGYGNGSGYGYPDPNYLDNVLAELASHGVTEDT